MLDTSLVHRVQAPQSGKGPYPALVLLHGVGSNEGDMMSLAPFVDPRLWVVAARAPFPRRYGGYSWFDYEAEGPGLGGPSIEESLVVLGRFLAEAVDRYSLDTERLYLGGFSQGAAMTGAFTLLEPGRIAGAVMASGFLPPDARPSRYRGQDLAGTPIFQAHGTYDNVVPMHFAHQTRDYLATTAADLTYREYPMGHEVTADELSDLAGWIRARLDGTGTKL